MFFNKLIINEMDNEKINSLYKLAVRENSEAQLKLGLCYQHGEGVEKDINLAKFW
jgi:TPR repeat protein